MKKSSSDKDRSLRAHRAANAILALLLIGVSASWLRHEHVRSTSGFNRLTIDGKAPHAKEVEELIKPLQYSAVADFMRPEVRLRLDFNAKSWTLTNVHRFDQFGRVVLDRGRYGICGDLAAYAFWRARLIFEDRYDIKIVRVSESSYFQDGAGTHYILKIRDRSLSEREGTFLLDPSLKRYGPPELFNAYLPGQTLEQLDFMKTRSPDESFGIGGGPPIHINPRAILSLYVMPVNGRFDPDHFALVLDLRKRYDYIGRNVYAIRRREGVVDRIVNNESASSLFSEGLLKKITQRMDELYERYERDSAARS